jgi:hypothetical protein
VSDDGLRALAGLTTLTGLNLWGVGQVSDDGLHALAGLTARIDPLQLWPCFGCESATHYIHCRGAPGVGGGNFFTSIHDAMLREVANMLHTVYPRGQVVSEDYVGAMSYSPLHCPDVTILDAGGFGVHTLVELTVFRATAAANVRSSTRMGPGGRLVHGSIGAALAAPQETRRASYGDLGQHRLLVFAVDEYGMMSRDRRCFTSASPSGRTGWTWRAAILRGRVGHSLPLGSSASR